MNITLKTIQVTTYFACGTVKVYQQFWQESHKKMRKIAKELGIKLQHFGKSQYAFSQHSTDEYNYDETE
jgi:hypothetical protein